MRRMPFTLRRWALALLLAPACASAALPPVPVPLENPLTEAKRVLGKILFWDEQLSSDGSIACGTCHRPGAGGADPRAARNPGTDKGTIDDVLGSPGIARLDHEGRPERDPVFGYGPQVGSRLAPSYFGALWADEVFWDGRAGGIVRDPKTGGVAIARGGALENQALLALGSSNEMAKAGRTWDELVAEIDAAAPLALATDWPPDVAAAIAARPTYRGLFAAAFGDASITALRIAFALASYERTLVADSTAWDRYAAGDSSTLSGSALAGWQAMQAFHCVACHTPPLFTNNQFLQIGLRRAAFDLGRQNVTHDVEDAGAMKVPSLRNAALRPRFMHTGEIDSLPAAIGFYLGTLPMPERDGIPGIGTYTFNMSAIDQANLRAFIEQGLTDPRVRAERFPFDRPTLRSERAALSAAPAAPPRITQ
jgi:cytochrome c peroxidase